MELRHCAACRALRPSGTLCAGCGGPLALADERLLLGEVFGKYRLESVLGAGGMGVVYRVTHATLGRPAALKIVLPRAGGEGFERRFLREARVLAELKHPAIVEIYDFDVSPWGPPYYVMECLEGATLRGVIGAAGGPLAPELVAALLSDVTPALTYAHRRGVVHRDLKPDNLFVAGFDGRALVKLLDFGIAKLLASDGAEPSTDLTQSGAVVGTPNYLAPEQILGQEIGPWTDQYALALIVAEALAGRAVRAGKTLGQILSSEIREPLDARRLPAGLPEGQRQALRRATEPEPGARFADVAGFVAALDLPRPTDAPRRLAEALARAAPAGQVSGTAALGRVPTPAGAPHEVTGTLVGGGPGEQATVARPAGWGQVAPTAAATATAAPAPVARGRRTRALALIVAALAIAGGARLWRARGPLVAPQPPTTQAATLFTARATLPVPPDATGLLGLSDQTAVLEGGQALYLAATTPGGLTTRIALGPDEQLLGRAADGGLWLLSDGKRLLHLDPLQQKREPWAEGLPRADGASPAQAGPLRVSPSGRFVAAVQAQAVEVCEVEQRRCRKRFSLPLPAGPVNLALGERHLVLARSGEVAVHALPDGGRLSSHELREARVGVLALHEDAGLVAVGGWFDHVDVLPLAGGAGWRLARQGRAVDLAWVPDRSLLLIAGDAGLSSWEPGADREQPVDGELRAARLLVDGDGILALDAVSQRLRVLDYGDLAPLARVRLSRQSIWGLAAGDGALYAGGQDGSLRRWEPATGAVEAFPLHSDGITDLALLGDHLASASDDKTVAIWQLPRMNVIWRSQAHGYLVNQLHLRGGPSPSLWTSSSDGLVKQWAWPQSEERQAVDTRRVLGRSYNLHAVWASGDARQLLVGTWNHALLVLRRDARGPWAGRALPVESQVVYQRAEAAGVDAVVLVGLYPHRAYAWDLRRGRLLALPDFGVAAYAAVPGAEPGEVLVPGVGGLLRYRLERGADGDLAARAWARLDTRLGPLLCGALLPGSPPRLAVGNGQGELVLLDLGRLFGRQLFEGRLAEARP